MSASHKVKCCMNLMSVIVFIPCILLVAGNTVFAEPYLQLDAGPAGYIDGDEESIVTTDLKFTLYALVNSLDSAFNPADTFYLSAAIVPDPGYDEPGPDLGSYYFDGSTLDVVGNMAYGTPPIEVYLESQNLPSHGIYETYYHEYSFTLDLDNKATLYNSMVTPGGPTDNPAGTLYYRAFDVDVSGLVHGYAMHFDLYTYGLNNKGTNVIDNFAPFSHDVLSAPIPASVILGVLGLGAAGLKLRRFA